jgi:hypothetical protein
MSTLCSVAHEYLEGEDLKNEVRAARKKMVAVPVGFARWP